MSIGQRKYRYKTYIGVYDTWPDVNNAEKEIIYRLVRACRLINVGLLIITNRGRIIGPKDQQHLMGYNIKSIDPHNIAFILSLHYQSPKSTHHHTLHALWNPADFINDSGQATEFMENIGTYDGFLSCHSQVTDDYFTERFDIPIVGYLNHTLSDPLLDPLDYFDNIKCFYAGINWERLGKYSPREHIFKALNDLGDDARIYGPRRFLGINVWDGFHSYQGEIPFDGKSLIYAIKDSGACLVFNSESHHRYEILSNRIFEGIAAGVPLICDNHPLIRKWFGDNVYYVDTQKSNCTQKIRIHLKNIKKFPNDTIKKILLCRKVFNRSFLLHKQIDQILYNNFCHKLDQLSV